MNNKINYIQKTESAAQKLPMPEQRVVSNPVQVQPRQLTRRERRIREAEIRRRLRKGLPMYRTDNRWRKLTDSQRQACVAVFKQQLAEALRTLQNNFSFAYPKTPEFDELLKNYPSIILSQTGDTEWTVMLPNDNGYTALNFQIDEAFAAGSDYCIVHAEGIAIEALAADNKLIKQIFKDDKHPGMYGVLLQNTESEIVKQIDKHGDLTVDAMLAIETIRRRSTRTVVYDKATIDMLAEEYDSILERIDVETGSDSSYRLTFTYASNE